MLQYGEHRRMNKMRYSKRSSSSDANFGGMGDSPYLAVIGNFRNFILALITSIST